MLPVLINIGQVKIYTFGVFLVLAFFWGAFLLWKNIRLTVHKEEEIFDGLFLSIFGGIFLGRLIYVLLNFNKFGLSIIKFILINGYPGFSLYGVLLGAFLTFFLYCSFKKLKFNELTDYLISPLFLTLGIGKLGSFFSGTEVGTTTRFVLSIKTVGLSSLRHLTPFYEALLFFAGAYLSHKLLFEVRKDKYSPGFSFYFFIWYFALIYFFCDKIKTYKLYLFSISFNEYVSLIILLTFTVYFLYYFRSLILLKIAKVKNYVKSYVRKTYSSTNKKIRKKTERGHSSN